MTRVQVPVPLPDKWVPGFCLPLAARQGSSHKVLSTRSRPKAAHRSCNFPSLVDVTHCRCAQLLGDTRVLFLFCGTPLGPARPYARATHSMHLLHLWKYGSEAVFMAAILLACSRQSEGVLQSAACSPCVHMHACWLAWSHCHCREGRVVSPRCSPGRLMKAKPDGTEQLPCRRTSSSCSRLVSPAATPPDAGAAAYRHKGITCSSPAKLTYWFGYSAATCFHECHAWHVGMQMDSRLNCDSQVVWSISLHAVAACRGCTEPKRQLCCTTQHGMRHCCSKSFTLPG